MGAGRESELRKSELETDKAIAFPTLIPRMPHLPQHGGLTDSVLRLHTMLEETTRARG